MPSARPGNGLLWGALGVLAFSVSLPATRLAVAGGLPGAFVGYGRGAVAGLLALAALAILRPPWPPRAAWPRLILVSAGVVIGWPVLTAMALTKVPSTHGIVITGIMPAVTAIMAVLRTDERPSLRFWLAAAAGLICVLAFAAAQGAGEITAADGLLLAAVACSSLGYAEGGALSRTLGGVQVICLALVLALPISLALLLWSWDGPALTQVTAPAWAGFAYVAAISSFAGFFPWYRGLALGGVARVGQVQLAQPVLSLVWASLLLGEAVTWPMVATSAAILACVVATQRAG